MQATARSEIETGTTTASPLPVVVAAGEAAVAAGTEIEGADGATLVTGPLRYGNLLLPCTSLPCLYHQTEWVITTGVQPMLNTYFFVFLYLCVLLLTIKHDFQ